MGQRVNGKRCELCGVWIRNQKEVMFCDSCERLQDQYNQLWTNGDPQMQAVTIYRAKDLAQAIHRQEAMPNAVALSESDLEDCRFIENPSDDSREYFNGDDGNIWLIDDGLILIRAEQSGKMTRKHIRIVGILRQNEDSKELLFDSEVFENSLEHRQYALKNNLLIYCED